MPGRGPGARAEVLVPFGPDSSGYPGQGWRRSSQTTLSGKCQEPVPPKRGQGRGVLGPRASSGHWDPSKEETLPLGFA